MAGEEAIVRAPSKLKKGAPSQATGLTRAKKATVQAPLKVKKRAPS